MIARPRRPGLAPLELVIALPALMIAVVLMFKFGEFHIKQAQYAVKARHRATKAADGLGVENAPLPSHSVAKALMRPIAPTEAGFARSNPKTNLNFRPAAPMTQPAAGRHATLFGTWDVKFKIRGNSDFIDERFRNILDADLERLLVSLDGLLGGGGPSSLETILKELAKIALNDSKAGDAIDLGKKILDSANPLDLIVGAVEFLKDGPEKVKEGVDGLTKVREIVGEGKKLLDLIQNPTRVPDDDF